MSKNGFTLIELLVVISIIGILAAMIMVSFTSSQRQARDTNRKSDLSQYRTALESFANANNGLYPSRAGALSGGTSANSTLCAIDLSLTTCPPDPKEGVSGYGYKYQSDGVGSGSVVATEYVLWAKLENSTNTYWVVCSNGQSGAIVSTGFSNLGGNCPL